jgi:hypothetical protein
VRWSDTSADKTAGAGASVSTSAFTSVLKESELRGDAKIENLEEYGTEFDRIVAAIYGHRGDKLELGPPPEYSQTAVDTLPGLTSVDTLVLKLSCQKAIEGFDYFIQTHDVWEQVDAVGVPLVEFNDSLEVLHGRGYIRTDDETLGSADESPLSYTIQIRGFEEYARAFVENY